MTDQIPTPTVAAWWAAPRTAFAWIWARLAVLRRDQSGYSTETVVVTALLVLLAIGVLAALAAAVLAKVNSIDLGETPLP